MNVKAGDKFIATIGGVKDVNGVIQIENEVVYLCQDLCEGEDCEDKLGYKYSWVICNIRYFSEDSLSDEDVKDFQLLSNRKSRIEKLNI